MFQKTERNSWEKLSQAEGGNGKNLAEQRAEQVCLTNMCMIEDGKGNVLALDKVNDSYTGTTFPGGHVEPGEPFWEAVVREETGLKICDPVLCGVYHWYRGKVHNVLFLYRARTFTGILRSSEEGRVYWISLEEFRKRDLAPGMESVVEILTSPQIQECWMHREAGKDVETLY